MPESDYESANNPNLSRAILCNAFVRCIGEEVIALGLHSRSESAFGALDLLAEADRVAGESEECMKSRQFADAARLAGDALGRHLIGPPPKLSSLAIQDAHLRARRQRLNRLPEDGLPLHGCELIRVIDQI